MTLPTEEQFESYEKVRRSGVTNMFALSKVARLSGLDNDTVLLIQDNYSELCRLYPFVKR